MTNGWKNSAIRAHIVAVLGLNPGADDDAIVEAARTLRMRSMIAAAVGVSPAVDDETLAGAITKRRNLIEAAKQSVREVRLHEADRRAIDATVAASSDPHADLRERAILDELGLPVAQTPPPVLLRKGTDRADYTKEQQYQEFAHKLGGRIAEGVPKPPGGDVYYLPSPNDHVEFVNGEWVEKAPYKEINGNG